MKNLYSQADANAAIAKYGVQGWNEDIALKTYTTRLIGQVPELVLHGGGNSSVKTRLKDTLGEEVDVLCVKGSGWDMGSIEPPGLPAVRLEPLRKLTKLDRLTDEDMVNFQRLNLLDSNAPNPSVETLFHAFLPAKFIDHTHANAVLGVSDHANGMDLLREVYGDRAPIVDYVMPGFDLAKRAGEVAAAHPKADGLVLHKHGIFAWGATAQESYDRMIELVSLAEARLAKAGRKVFAAAPLPAKLASAAEIAPLIRGVLALPSGEGRFKRFVLDLRKSPAVMNFVNGAEVQRYARSGVITPDHVIRTKGKPMVVAAPVAGELDAFASNLRAERAAYDAEYRAYFETHNARVGGIKKILDTSPRVVLVPGIGAFCAGATSKDAKIAGDLIENAAAAIADAEALGRFESVSEADLFDVEYWSLEQAKLGKAAEKRLQRHVALVTGGASGIGLASAAAFAAEGCEIVILDRDGASAQAAARKFGGLGLACDVTQPGDVRAAFDAAVARFGGVDIVVSNAGAAWQGKIGEVDEKVLRDSFELNFFAHQHVAQNAVRVMKAQGTGGALLFNVSKQAVNPGPDFGPYGLPKASTLFLLRQYAVDYGSLGIRANGINADRVRTGLLTDAMIASRSKARGLSERDYMGGNLLGREVTAEDVAQAFVFLALAEKTTGAILTVDGGNIAAALR
ncbi:MAG: bifunctional aldolase/short-chain dehydrogenase [Rhodospirillales bacterium]|jgi:rhamnose utilization protein RhaD (predicted bifunctional aldolase and dehydrogenase)/NAD(P)-dependent dehydrogenase (short-subunit alcohol dehydrogenase family)